MAKHNLRRNFANHIELQSDFPYVCQEKLMNPNLCCDDQQKLVSCLHGFNTRSPRKVRNKNVF